MFLAGCTFYGPSNQSAVVAFSEPLAQWMPRMAAWLVPLVLLLILLPPLLLLFLFAVSPFVAHKIYEPTQLRILQLWQFWRRFAIFRSALLSFFFFSTVLEFITNAFWQFRLFSFYGRKFSSSLPSFVRALQPDPRVARGGSMHAINKGPKYLQAHNGNNLINLKQYATGSTKHHDDDEVVWQISPTKLFDFWLGEGTQIVCPLTFTWQSSSCRNKSTFYAELRTIK